MELENQVAGLKEENVKNEDLVISDNILDCKVEESVETVFGNVCRKPVGVYVQRDKKGNIVRIDSDIFIDDLDGWEKIDEGFGDKYAHAQTQYLDRIDCE